MKIAEYNDMMAYLTRPGFSGGSKKPTLEDLKKSGQIVTGDKYKPKKPKYIKLQEIIDFELRNPRKTKSEGGPLVPEPKPYTLEQFQERADLLIKGALGGFPKDEMINKLQIELDKVQESGTLSKEEAINFINERTQQLREYIKNNPGETLPELETREEFKKAGFAKATTAKLLKETVPNYLDEETFVKLRKEKKDFTNREFAEFLNKEGYKPDPRQAKEFGEISVERRFTAAKNKGLFPKTFIYKGSKASKAVTPKERKEYVKYIKQKFPSKYKDILKLPEDKLKTKILDRRSYLNKIKKPGFQEAKNERNRRYRFEVSSGLRGKEAQRIYLEKAAEYKRARDKDANAFYRNVRDGKTLLWEDLLKRTTVTKDPPFKLNKKIIKGKKYTKDETQKFVLTDKDGNKFRYNSLREDLAKAGQDPQKVFKPYEQKAFLYRENLMKQIVENADKILGARDNPIHVHHVEGFSKNPFNTQLTFADQNLREGNARQTLTATFNNILKEERAKTGGDTAGILNFNRKKKALNKFYDSLGPDIAAQIGKQEVGTRTPLIDMLKKKNIKMSPEVRQQAMQLGANPMADPSMLKQYGKYALQIAGTPLGVAGLTAGFGVDPSSAIDRVALGAEAALAPTLVKGAAEAATNPVTQRILNLGLSPQMAMRAARVAQPLGVASLVGEGLYQLGKRGAAEKAKLDAMTPFQKQQYLAGEVEPLMDEGGIVDISREGFADGPEDPSKRKFMKVMGGLTALPFVGKFFKVAERAAPIVDKIKTTDLPGKPEWFDALVNKVIREGTDMTKQFATKEREIVHATKISEDEFVRVHQDLETGSVRVDYDSPFNMGEETVSLEFRPGIADETTRGKPRDQFQATEVEPRYVGGPEDADMEFDGIGGGSSIKMLESDVSNLEKYATGKNPTMKELVDSKKRKDRVKAINEDQLEAAEYISGKYGDGPEPDYDDFID